MMARTDRMPRDLTVRYIAALSLLAGLVMVGFLSEHTVTKKTEANSAIVNLAGRQRMLSQQIALKANQMAWSEDARQYKKFQASIDEMRRAHEALAKGAAHPSLRKPVKNTPALEAAYFRAPLSADEKVSRFLAAAANIAHKAENNTLRPDDADLNIVLALSGGPLLDALEGAVIAHEKEGLAAIIRLEKIEMAVWSAIILVLFFEAFCIFARTARRVRTSRGDVQKARAELAESREETLHAAEGLARAQQLAKIGSWEWRVTEDKMYWSDEMHRIFGTDPETFKETYEGFIERVHPDDRDRVNNVVYKMLEDGASFDIDFRILPSNADGDKIIGNARSEVIKDAEGRPVLFSGTVMDITERKKSEAQLANSRSFLARILESVQDGIVACNAKGELTLFNKAAREFHGLDVKPVAPGEWAETYALFEADGQTQLVPARIPLHRAFEGEIVDKQEMIIAPQGLPVRMIIARASPLYDANNKRIGAVATLHDVTEERAREREIRRQKDELEMILNNVPVRIWHKDDKNRIIRLNRQAAQSLGMTIEEAEGADSYELFPETAKKYHDDDLEIINSGVPKFGIIEEYTPSKGEHGWVSTNKVPYIDPQSGKRFVFVASTDITDIKKTQNELERSNRELEQFARVASHDLQEPLRKMMIFSEFLSKDLSDDISEKARADLDAITDAARRMQQLIKDILSLSRMQSGAHDMQPVDPRECVERAMATWAQRCKELGASVIYDDLPMVMADPVLLIQIYHNLLGNALKFVAEGRRPRINMTAEVRGRQVILGVEDNGIGIAPENCEKIFEPLARLHSRDKFDGTGIGLAICKKAVERAGGRIWVESEIGKGSHFRFALKGVASAQSAA